MKMQNHPYPLSHTVYIGSWSFYYSVTLRVEVVLHFCLPICRTTPTLKVNVRFCNANPKSANHLWKGNQCRTAYIVFPDLNEILHHFTHRTYFCVIENHFSFHVSYLSGMYWRWSSRRILEIFWTPACPCCRCCGCPTRPRWGAGPCPPTPCHRCRAGRAGEGGRSRVTTWYRPRPELVCWTSDCTRKNFFNF